MSELIDHEAFQSHGLIRCEKFLPAAKVACARSAVLQHFERKGLRRNGAWTARKGSPTANADFTKRLRMALQDDQRILALTAEEIQSVVETLLDGHIAYPMLPYPHLLFTLPNAETWAVSHDAWHLDMPRLANPGIPGVQIFTFLERVLPGGGGTLVVTGSHHLLNKKSKISSRELKKRLQKEPYFAALMAKGTPDRQRFLDEPGYVADVALQVVELHGEPGDVYFMDLRLLHTVAPNASATPRVMLTQRYLLEEARDAIYGTPTKS